jgi:integrase
MGMNLDRITTEELDSLALAGSPSYVNQALRTLRRLLGKAVEWKVIAGAPTVRLMEEAGRELTIDPETEAKLLAVAKQPLKDVLVLIQDTGMRPEEVFRIRIENIDWSQRFDLQSERKDQSSAPACADQRTNVKPVIDSLFEQTGGPAAPFTQG